MIRQSRQEGHYSTYFRGNYRYSSLKCLPTCSKSRAPAASRGSVWTHSQQGRRGAEKRMQQKLDTWSFWKLGTHGSYKSREDCRDAFPSTYPHQRKVPVAYYHLRSCSILIRNPRNKCLPNFLMSSAAESASHEGSLAGSVPRCRHTIPHPCIFCRQVPSPTPPPKKTRIIKLDLSPAVSEFC